MPGNPIASPCYSARFHAVSEEDLDFCLDSHHTSIISKPGAKQKRIVTESKANTQRQRRCILPFFSLSFLFGGKRNKNTGIDHECAYVKDGHGKDCQYAYETS